MKNARNIRTCLFVTIAAAMGCSAAVPEMNHLDPFGRTAASALDAVGRFDQRAALGWGRPARKAGFKFYGDSQQELVTLDCEQSQLFEVIVNSNQQAEFNLGACSKEAQQIRERAAAAEGVAGRFLIMQRGNPSPDDLARATRMIGYRAVPLANGMTGYTFAVIEVGHGFTFTHTAVVYDPARKIAFVAQGDVMGLCGMFEENPSISSPFCPEPNKALLDVAVDLARRHK